MPFAAALIFSILLAQGPSPAPNAGDAAFARGDFRTAFTEYNDAIAKDPFDADAVLGIGTLDLYRNDWQNARTYLERARHLSPNDPRISSRLAVLEERLPKSGEYHFELQNGRTDIPLVAVDPVPLVKATIGARTVTLAVDTFASSIVLTSSVAQSLGLADGGLVPSITFPGLEVTNVPATIVNAYTAGTTPVDGAIGTVFLSHFLPTFDYAHARLTLRRWEASPTLDADAARAGAAIEPMWLITDRLLVASGHVGGDPPMMFGINTGRSDAVVAIDGPLPADSMLSVVALGRYAQGPVRAAQLPLDAFDRLPFRVGGVICNGFFRPATLTLDFASMKIIVSK